MYMYVLKTCINLRELALDSSNTSLVWDGLVIVAFVLKHEVRNSGSYRDSNNAGSNYGRRSTTGIANWAWFSRCRSRFWRRNPIIALLSSIVPPSIATVRRWSHCGCQGGIPEDKVASWRIETCQVCFVAILQVGE